MQVKNLFRYVVDNQIIDSLEQPLQEYVIRYRLVAEEGKKLTCGNGIFVDTVDIDKYAMRFWQEVDPQ